MIARFRLLLAYDGRAYHGWQIQERPDAPPTIQGAVEAALFAICGRKIRVYGASRTDAGVHAYGQAAHFDLPEGEDWRRDWRHSLNALLPRDIRILQAERTSGEFHARKSALSKTYVYHYWQEPAFILPSISRRAWSVGPLDLDAMARAARLLQGEMDFASFQNRGTEIRDTTRKILEIGVRELAPQPWVPPHLPMLELTITANGFLKQMCRNLAGFLAYVGKNRLAPESLAAILAARDRRSLASPTAPAHGLALAAVSYPPPTTNARG